MTGQIKYFLYSYVVSTSGLIFLYWGLSWALLFLFGNSLVDRLKNRPGMKWTPREDTPDTHLQKAGTPSMGGIGILGAAFQGWLAVISFLFGASWFFSHSLSELPYYLSYGVFPLFVLLNAGLGYLDDHSKAINKGGLTSKAKLFGQILLAVGYIFALCLDDANSNTLILLFSSSWTIFGVVLVIVGCSNAVNLTDGIDGLVAGLSVQVALVFTLLMVDRSYWSMGTGGSSAIFFWMALGGACMAFLNLNKHPAKVFMGDTGSLALGAALGAGAVLTRTVWLLPFIGFIFFVEMFSVIIQVAYFKFTKHCTGEGQRIFRRAPLHHHFELGGWSEWRIVATFWLINLVTSGIGLFLWKTGVLSRFP